MSNLIKFMAIWTSGVVFGFILGIYSMETKTPIVHNSCEMPQTPAHIGVKASTSMGTGTDNTPSFYYDKKNDKIERIGK